jgi:hypothetical protein
MRSEALKKSQKKYQQSSKGKISIRKAVNKWQNSEDGKIKLRKSQKKYDKSEKGKANKKKGSKKYQQTKKGKAAVYKSQVKYYNKRIKNDPAFKLIINVRGRLRAFLRSKGINKQNKTIELIGCSKESLKEHLEKQFKPGMNWSNHSSKGWHIDHVKPLSKFDCSDPDQLKKACHYSNLQPLWAEENLKKYNR